MMIGKLLSGRYELIEKIGEGGMAVVYLAQDPALGRLVAVKALDGRPGNGHGGHRSSFLREARAAGQLQHINVVSVHEVGEEQGQFYYTMDYIEGKDLDDVVSLELVQGSKGA